MAGRGWRQLAGHRGITAGSGAVAGAAGLGWAGLGWAGDNPALLPSWNVERYFDGTPAPVRCALTCN